MGELKRLDVGCGQHPAGDVNVDLYPNGDGVARRGGEEMDVKHVKNFVKADAFHLPFSNETFDKVICSHTIEHTAEPFKLLKELVRVSKDTIVIRCPHGFGDTMRSLINGRCLGWNKKHHLSSFNHAWFTVAAARLRLDCEVSNSRFYCYPHRFIPLVTVPCEITAVLKKE